MMLRWPIALLVIATLGLSSASANVLERLRLALPSEAITMELSAEVRSTAQPDCATIPVGVEKGTIPDTAMTASSQFDGGSAARCGRLNQPGSATCTSRAWVAKTNDKTQWIQVQLATPAFIAAIATQGRNSAALAHWVTEFYLYTSMDGQNFRPYATPGSTEPKRFVANTNAGSVVLQRLPTPVQALAVRVNPYSWNTQIAMTVELFTCSADSPCSELNGGCDARTTCTRVGTSWAVQCSSCPAGYAGNGIVGCTDIDECAQHNGGCDIRTACTNTPGSRTCTECPTGFQGNGANAGGCADVNECLTNNGGCDVRTNCINRPGTRLCSPCPTGFSGDPAVGCIDLDECAHNNGGCDDLTTCINTPGGRTCGACPAHYTGTGANGCVDVDECALENGGCDSHVVCTNTPGSRLCGACPSGYSGDGAIGCVGVGSNLIKVNVTTPEMMMNDAALKAAQRTASALVRNMAERDQAMQEQAAQQERVERLEELQDRLQDLSWRAQITSQQRAQVEAQTAQEQQEIIAQSANLQASNILDRARAEVSNLYTQQINPTIPAEVVPEVIGNAMDDARADIQSILTARAAEQAAAAPAAPATPVASTVASAQSQAAGAGPDAPLTAPAGAPISQLEMNSLYGSFEAARKGNPYEGMTIDPLENVFM